MAPEPPGSDSASPHDINPLVFVSDESDEGERLAAVLRARGYSVVDVPPGRLIERALARPPSLVILDVDANGAMGNLKALRSIPGGKQVTVLAVGELGKTFDLHAAELGQETGDMHVRPIDVYAVLRRVETLLGAPSALPGGSLMPPSNRLAQRPSGPAPSRTSEPSIPPRIRPSLPPSAPLSSSPPRAPVSSLRPPSPSVTRRPPPSPRGKPGRERAPVSSLSDAEPLTLGFDPNAAPASGARSQRLVPGTELSPELQSLLASAELRISATGTVPSHSGGARPSPEEEVEAVLPAEVLAALDEPLEDDGDEVGSRASSGAYGTGSDSGRGTGGSKTGNWPGTAANPTGAVSSSLVGTVGGSGVTRLMPEETRLASAKHQEASSAGVSAGKIREDSGDAPGSRGGVEDEFGPATAPRDKSEPSTNPPPRASVGEAGRASFPPISENGTHPGPLSRGSTGPHRGPLSEAAPQTVPRQVPAGVRPTAPPSGPDEAALPSAPTHPPSPEAATTGGERFVVEPQLAEEIPKALGPGDAVRALARVIRARYTGAAAFETDAGIHRIAFRDGDFVTAAAGIENESLVAFLVQRGALSQAIANQLGRKVPPFGRHAGAALIANGHLRQDELWPVLRAHAEWLVSRALTIERGAASLEEVPPRLRAEPAVFGGATGAEVFVELVRRAIDAETAIARLGGLETQFAEGPNSSLLSECGLPDHEAPLVNRARSGKLGQVLEIANAPDFATVLYALTELGILERVRAIPARRNRPQAPAGDALDDAARRAQILARKALIEEGDYFAILGVSRQATGYDIRRAYVQLKRDLEPERALSARNTDLKENLDLILEVIDEAYEILGDQVRRDRYRRALEAPP